MVTGKVNTIPAPKRQTKPLADQFMEQARKERSIVKMAEEIIAGKHGNGHENRRKSLGISKSEYEKVRAEVNKKASGVSKAKPKPKKSIAQMANEIIAGKHGYGHENRRKSLGISKTEYEKVRKEVNRRLK